MGASTEEFLTSAAAYAAVCLFVFLCFGFFRRLPATHHFYNPKRYKRGKGVHRRPKRLPRGMLSWIVAVYKIKQEEVIEVAGYDAAAYMRILTMGTEFFIFTAFWVCLVVLPTNLSGHQVETLIGKSRVEPSNFTYWVPPPPPPSPPGTPQAPSSSQSRPQPVKAPEFYERAPPAPPGLVWYEYRDNVPPLPQPAQYFNSSRWDGWVWRYDENFQISDYTFSNLDLTTMANVGAGDPRVWVHIVSAWVISWFAWRLLWRYNREAVALRIAYLNSARPGGEAHTVLTTDIPGVEYGTLAHRIEQTVLRVLPKFLKRRITRAAAKTLHVVDSSVNLVLDAPLRVTGADANVHTPPATDPTSGPSPGGGGGDEEAPHDRRSGQRRYEGDKGSPPNVAIDAWAEAERELRAGVGIKELVQKTVEDAFPGAVVRVHAVYDTSRLEPLVAEYEQTARRLADLLDDYTSRLRRHRSVKRRKMTVLGLTYGSWGIDRYGTKPTQVDALAFYADRLRELLSQIAAEKETAMPPNESAMPSALTTFRERRDQAIASTSMLHHDRRAWLTQAAPGPDDIIWRNLGWRRWERQLRTGAAWVAFFALVSFYIPVVTAIQALLQVEKLVTLPGLRELLQTWPLLASAVSSFLPQLTLRVFLALLPTLLALLGRAEGRVAESQVEFGCVRRYFIFQVLTVFFASFIAGSFLNQIQQFANAPATIFSVLGTAAPQTATFFMSYLLLLGFTTKPLLFLRLTDLIKFWVMSRLSSTERAKARLWENQFIDFGYEVPDHMMALLLGLVFCIVAPPIAVIAAAYFLVNSIIARYQLCYVYTPRFETGGQIWSEVSNQAFFALLTFQVVMFGLLGLKSSGVGSAALQTVALLPLPLLTLAQWVSVTDLFATPLRVLSLKAAAELDRRDQMQGGRQEELEGDAAAALYRPPALRIDGRKAAALLAEAERMAAALDDRPPRADLPDPDTRVEAYRAGAISDDDIGDDEDDDDRGWGRTADKGKRRGGGGDHLSEHLLTE
ncbi:hypothetical protein WJX81_008012 [Elliptochloris bilobata]|uniref:DUF221-domain-containing protein n=1 Tax=Elliptochloris bilobata TaxID=381761 RepID=A0AAW1SC18_9CHLO